MRDSLKIRAKAKPSVKKKRARRISWERGNNKDFKNGLRRLHEDPFLQKEPKRRGDRDPVYKLINRKTGIK